MMNESYNIVLKIISQNQGCTINDIFRETNGKLEIEECATLVGNLVDKQKLYFYRAEEKYYYVDNNHFIGYFFMRREGSFVEEWFKRTKKITRIHDVPKDVERGDFVLYEIKNSRVLILKIIKKNKRLLSGTVKYGEENNIFVFGGKPFRKPIHLTNSNDNDINNRVFVKIIGEQENYINAEIIKRVGLENDINIDHKNVISEFDIRHNFSSELLKYVDNVSTEEISKITEKKRKDLTSLNFITIDGEDAKDLDDAIYVEKTNDGCYRLIVSIADVSSYVKEESILDKEALQRSTSVYLINSVIPMLPKRLSNNLCSLNPDTLKLTISCEIIFDKSGNVLQKKVYPSIIKSKKRFSYKQINKYFHKKINEIEFCDMLDESYNLYKILHKKFYDNGYIEFKINDIKILLDNKNNPIDIVVKKQDHAEKMIEFFMLSANSAVAEICHDKKIPILYRVHNNPNNDMYKNAINSLKTLSRSFKIIDDASKIDSKYIQYILNIFNDSEYRYIANNLLLKSMDKAKYDFRNIGHFAIGIKNYCHFTSPIRRYPDLVVHRMLWKCLFNKQEINLDKEIPKLIKCSSINNEKEISAQMCERKLNSIKKARYMLKNQGGRFEATISSVIRKGIFLELPNSVSGMINIYDLRGDFFIFNNNKSCLFGKNTGKKYSIGQIHWVRIKHIYPTTGQIDFILDKNYNNRW